MKENKTSSPIQKGVYLVPEDILDTLVANQDRILAILEAKKEATLNGFITEKDAIAVVNKKTTWFWQMRKTGQLPFKKNRSNDLLFKGRSQFASSILK